MSDTTKLTGCGSNDCDAGQEVICTNPGCQQGNLPVSQLIRDRLLEAGAKFSCNDNISQFITPEEREALVDEVASKMEGVLRSLVIDIDNDHNTRDTARRVAKMYVNET